MAVRLAKASDLAATSQIAFRSFSLSPWNAFYRPHAAEYPSDVVKSYLREQQEALNDRKKLFTVVESETDSKSTPATKQVVGFAIWNFSSSQQRESGTAAVEPEDTQDRSVDPVRGKLLFGATESAAERCLKGYMELDNMAVDPDHFRKGYGTLLCRYGMEIAEADKVPVGVIAAELGMKLYKALGYSSDVKVNLTDCRPGKEANVDFWVQKWEIQVPG